MKQNHILKNSISCCYQTIEVSRRWGQSRRVTNDVAIFRRMDLFAYKITLTLVENRWGPSDNQVRNKFLNCF